MRTTTVSIDVTAQVHVTIVADGVTAGRECCPRCLADTLVVRGPGYHDASIECVRCGAVMAAPQKVGG